MLITRSNARAAGTAVRTVADNRVVSEGVNHTASANQNTVAGVAVDHVLIDGSAWNTDVSGIAGADAILAVHRDLAIPNEHVREIRTCCVGENTIRRVVGEHRIARRHARTGSGVQAIRAAD